MDTSFTRSPFRTLLVVVATIFVVEFGVILGLHWFVPRLATWAEVLLDSSLLAILMVPYIYQFVVRPLARQIALRAQSAAALRKPHAELEIRIRECTLELEQANQTLRESESKYRSLVMDIDDGFFVTDDRGVLTFANPALARLHGFEYPEQLVGKGFLEFIAPAMLKEVAGHFREAIEGDKPRETITVEIVRPDGTQAVVEVKPFPIMEGGKVVGTRGLVRDITGRQQVEEALRESEAKSRAILNAIPDLMFRLNRDGVYLDFRAHRESDLYVPPDAIIGRSLRELLPPGVADLSLRYVRKTLESSEGQVFEYSLPMPSGLRQYEARMTVSNANEVMTIVRDITEQVQVNQRLQANLRELERRNQQAAMLHQMGEMLQVCNTMEEAYHVIGRAAQSLFPRTAGALCMYSPSRNDLETKTTWGTTRVFQPMFMANECWALRRGRVHHEIPSGLEPFCHSCHDKFENNCLCVPMMAQGEATGILHLCAEQSLALTAGDAAEALDERLAITVAEQVALALANLNLRETLRHQAIRDPLTGLFNRRYLEETLDREIHRAQRKNTLLSVFMLDIDHFKQFNDTYGHEAGDSLLRELGAYLQSQIRADDVACRYGGEEFTLVLPETLPDAALERAEHLREGVRHLEAKHRGKLLGTVTLSIGISVYPADGNTGETLLRAADRALYRAKAEGRDRVFVSES